MSGVPRIVGWCAGAALLVSHQLAFAQTGTGEFLTNYDFSDIDEYGMATGWEYPQVEGQPYNFMSPEANKYMITVDETEFNTAPHSMLITVTNASTLPEDGHFAQGMKTPERWQGQTLTVSAWVKTEILGGAEAALQVVIATGKSAPSPVWWEHVDWHVIGMALGTSGWTEITGSATISSEATTMVFRLYVGPAVAAGSKIWVDGITISAPGVGVRPSLTREQFVPVSSNGARYFLDGRKLSEAAIKLLPNTTGAVISTMSGQKSGITILR